MFDKLENVVNRYEQIGIELTRPDVASNNELFRKLMKEHSELTPIVEKYKEYQSAKAAEKDALEILAEPNLDKDFKELAEEELKEAKENIEIFANELKILLLPKDPNDDKNVIIEIRGGAGGEEAALFAGSLYRMYTMYAEGELLNCFEITEENCLAWITDSPTPDTQTGGSAGSDTVE